MTELYLKKNEGQWTRVFFDSTQPFRLTRENPYFQQSDSYTLDVTMPMDILDNRQFFGSLNRKDVGKRYTEYSCRLMVGNVFVMDGTAHLTQVTQDTVKVQLSTGVSALKMSAAQEAQYIDELDLGGESPDYGLTTRLDMGASTGGFYPIFMDETNEVAVNLCTADTFLGRYAPYKSECLTLVGLAKRIAIKMGYQLDTSYLPEACSHIYVVSGAQNRISRKLPHWTVKKFLQEFQNFFGCIFLSAGGKSLRLSPLSAYAGNNVVMLEPIEEYSSEFSEDDEAEGIINSNVEYAMETSDTEIVDEEILAQAQYDVSYNTRNAMENAFASDAADVKTHKLYRYAGHIYIAWEIGESSYQLRCVAPFNPLVRFPDSEHKSLKITPAHLEEDVENTVFYYLGLTDGREVPVTLNLPSVSNPYPIVNSISGISSGGTAETPTMQGLIEGTESIVDNEDKPDVINVVFIDGQLETVNVTKDVNGHDLPRAFSADVCLAFTDYDYKKQLTNNHQRWSFSLQPLENYDFYMGQLHVLGFECNRKVKHVFKFLADQMPDPTNIFVIRNKRYGCEKIEANVNEEGYDKLMTGYFYEMS